MKKILLIGGGGYIGSYFNLKTSKKYEITNVDINWFSEKKNSVDLKNLSNEFIRIFVRHPYPSKIVQVGPNHWLQ